MNHYDGPAFFRKYRTSKPQVNNSAASQSSSAATSASSQARPVSATAVPLSHAAVTSQAASASQATSAESSTLFNGGTHGSFHPSRVPSQLSAALTNGGIIQSPDKRNYLAIEASLHKSAATFMLFADAQTMDMPVVDLQQPVSASSMATTDSEAESQAVTANTESEALSQVVPAAATEVFEPTHPEMAASAAALNLVTINSQVSQVVESMAAESAAPVEQLTSAALDRVITSMATETFEPTQPELAESAAMSNATSSDESAVVTSAAATEVFEPTQPELAESAAAINAVSASAPLVESVVAAITVFEPHAPELAASAAAVNEASALKTTLTADEDDTTAKPVHGLGLSLDAIMTAEHDAQSDLALFKDKPTSDTSEVAEPDDEPYQPVGMRPTPTSTVAPRSEQTVSTPSRAVVQPTNVAVSSAVNANSVTEEDVTMPVHESESVAPVMTDRELAAYHLPPLDLLKAPVIPNESEMDDWIEQKASALDESLDAFGVNANVIDWTIGPTVTQFQVKLARGVKVSKITNLNDDLKLALAAKDIRIEAPIPGRNTVGIEIPNLKSRPVMLSEVLDSDKFRESKSPLTVALGVDLFGQPQVTDLRKMPHGLIAGATGSGKSVFINSILVSILYKANPQEVKLLLIDPKAVELAPYNEIPHLLAPVISEPKAASAALKWVVDEMDNRYDKLAAGGARNIEQFNKLAEEHNEHGLKLPYIVIVIDELAVLMMVASSEVQDYIARITQKARAAGIHLLVATQRPSVDVVTGLIKNNIPTRVAFMVASQIDSRTILDASGAERLLGRGDMLYLGNGQSTPVRLQGTFVDSEIDSITQFVRDQAGPHYEFQPDSLMKHEEAARNQDELMPEVLAYIADEDTMSTSKLQRNFSVGYNRAANIIDDLENQGYISAAKGSKPRDIYFTAADLAKMQADS
ncbi:DNA translocase FtsK [Lactiplantibacillus herbarum]|uniref:DNA translocase FtsK n=1 Tax=Lactiplantibacillus herbarum TaxID=1670446 RepID=UPI00064FA65B|nr:DNA translocase FtsK [Lactiplantibacillus herbarum]